MKCYVITLCKDAVKVRALQQDLFKQGMSVEFVDAVDGRKKMPDTCENEKIEQDISVRRRRARLTGSEVGCYLSHLRVIRSAYEAGEEKIIVMEDDVQIEPAFGEVVGRLATLDQRYQHIRLMTTKRVVRREVATVHDGYTLCRPVDGVLGTQAYLINRDGMAILLKYGARIEMPIDKLFDRFWMTGLRSFYIEPHIVWDEMEGSSIDRSRERDLSTGLWGYLEWKFYRLLQRFKRRLFLLRNISEFFGAKVPPRYIGRAERLQK